MASIDAIQYGTPTTWQGYLRNAVRQHDDNVKQLTLILNKMNHENDDSDFTQLETDFGLVAGQGAAARNELAAYLGKLTTDSSVEFVQAAREQFVAKLI